MGGETEQWFGPGETARRLGVTTKALRVYEREGLVDPHRAEAGWRLYGPAQVARLHQVIVLRDLGLPLKSIKKLIGNQSRLQDVLRLQRESLGSQQDKITRAIGLIETAQRQLDEGRDLSLDDLAILIKETVVQQPTDLKRKFAAKFESLVAERDPTGQASRAFEELKKDIRSNVGDALKAELKAMIAQAGRLKEAGDVNSEAAKEIVRCWRSRTADIRRPMAQAELMRDAYAEAVADAEAKSEPLPFDPAAIEFIRQVARGMKERGELD
jgi:DNA-binding transcriptional MerR regulator